MKIVFISDIHGVPSTLDKALSRAELLKAEKIVLLGDILYHGPRNGVPDFYDPRKVADMLNKIKGKLTAVQGNCDCEVDQMMLEFPIMARYSELLTEKRHFFLTHGHIWNECNPPPLSGEFTLCHGHTHIPVLKKAKDGVMIFNPGSISLPKMGNPRSFGFFDGERLSVRRLDDGEIMLKEE